MKQTEVHGNVRIPQTRKRTTSCKKPVSAWPINT